MAKNSVIVSETDTSKNAVTTTKEAAIKTVHHTEEVTQKSTEDVKQNHTENGNSYIYIGPTIPGAGFMSNTVLKGNKQDILNYCKDVTEKYPKVERLIVPTEKLAESRSKIQSSDNVLSKYYNELSAQIRQKGSIK